MNVLNELQNYIEKIRDKRVICRLIYDTTKHTLSAGEFHQHCDNKGPTLTILYGNHNVEYGGYTTQSWYTVTGSRTDGKAFIFTTKGGHLEVLEIRDGNGQNAIYCHERYGPSFGQTYFVSSEFLTFYDGPITTDNRGMCRLNGNITSINSFGKKHKHISPTEINGGSMDVKRLEVYAVVCDELNDPWLSIKRSSDQLRQSLLGQSRPGLEGMEFNILLVGQIGSGKSSFINTAISAMSDRMSHTAFASCSQHSATYKFSRYDLTPNSSEKKVYVFDVRGIEERREMKYELEAILQGKLPLGYEFPKKEKDIPRSELCVTGKSFGRINIVCFVTDSTTHQLMSKETLEKFKEMKQIAIKLEIQQVVVVTKLDEAYRSINNKHTHIFKRISVKEIFEGIGKYFGLTPKLVYPVINYTSQETTEEIKNQLVLHALSSMVKLAEDQAVAKLGDRLEYPWLSIKQSSDELRQSLHRKSRIGLEAMHFNILLVGRISSGKIIIH